jgi:hypothetical protein
MTRVSFASAVFAALIVAVTPRSAFPQVGTTNTSAGSHLLTTAAPVGSLASTTTQQMRLRVSRKSGTCTDPNHSPELDCTSTTLVGDTLRPPLYYEKSRWLRTGMEPVQKVRLCIPNTSQCFVTLIQEYKRDGERYQELRKDERFSDLSNLPRCLMLTWPEDRSVSSFAFTVAPPDGAARDCR